MPPGGFEPTIPKIERTQIHALERVTTGISKASDKASEQWKIKTWEQLSFLWKAYRGVLYQKKKRQSVSVNDYSLPSTVQVKNKWSYNPTPLLPVTAS